MKILYKLFISVFLLSSIISCSNNKESDLFQGVITYENNFVPKTKNYSIEALQTIFGKKSTLFFKEGNYLQKYDQGVILEQIYNKEENKIYVKKNLADSLFWTDCAKNNDQIIDFKIEKKSEIILNTNCDKLIIHYKDKTITYFFNGENLKIDPNWFSNYKYANRYKIAQLMKTLYYKCVIEYQDFIVTITATSIVEKELDDALFEISDNKILVEDKE